MGAVSHGARYRGVSRREGREDAQWVAFIQQDKRKYYLGCWTHEEDAARAYDKAALCTKVTLLPTQMDPRIGQPWHCSAGFMPSLQNLQSPAGAAPAFSKQL